MILTNKQEEGLRIAVDRYRNHEAYTCIAGYAGSGKSTLVKFIIAALNVNEEEVAYVAFTGKAATVLASKGCANATTAHQLLYYAKQKKDGTYIFEPRTSADFADYKVIVVDEVSMLPKHMWELLLTHHVYVLAMGDPGQLPPIHEDDDNHVLDNPHVFLDEIMRQALDSEIIRLSMHIREGKPLNSYKPTGEQVQIYNKWEFYPAMAMWADQILCASNQKRIELNKLVRAEKGYPADHPVVNDKIVGLHNHWDDASTSGKWPLTNGTIGSIMDYYISTERVPFYISDKPITYMYTNIELEDGDTFFGLPIDYNQLLTGEPSLTGAQIYKLKKNKKLGLVPPYDFAYSYAITTWKAQGSEYNKVLGFEEGHPYDKETHKKYLYTMITRAKEKVVIIKK